MGHVAGRKVDLLLSAIGRVDVDVFTNGRILNMCYTCWGKLKILLDTFVSCCWTKVRICKVLVLRYLQQIILIPRRCCLGPSSMWIMSIPRPPVFQNQGLVLEEIGQTNHITSAIV